MSEPLRVLAWAVDPRNFSFRMRTGVLALLALAVVPAALTASQLSHLTWALFLVMFAMSWDVVSGYTGQISFGHTFFFGIGGYTTAVLNIQHGVSPVVGILVGTLLAAVGGILIGVPALRVRGPYLALLTMVAPLMLFGIIVAFATELPVLAPEGLGGAAGYVTPTDPLVGTAPGAVITVDTFAMKIVLEYYVVLALLAVIMFACFTLTGSEAGEIFTAIREDHRAVASAGVNPAKFKIFAFVFSGLVGGLAGGAFVTTSAGNPIDPMQLVMVDRAIEIIIMAVLGGIGTIIGAIFGALFFAAVSLVVGAVDVTIPYLGMTLDQTMPAPLFLAAIFVLMYRPDGLVGWLEEVTSRRDETDLHPTAGPLGRPGRVVTALRERFRQ